MTCLPVLLRLVFPQFIHDHGHKTPKLFVMSMRDYLEGFWAQMVPSIMDLYHALHDSAINKTKGKISLFISCV